MNNQIQTDFDQHWQANPLSQVSHSKLREVKIFFQPVLDLLRTKQVKVLDIGCGDGVHWRYLRCIGNDLLSYTGIDISPSVIEYMQQLKDSKKDHFIQMDAIALKEPDNSYDIAFAFGVLGYTSNPNRTFAEICRVCKPNGWVGIWAYPQQEGLARFAFSFTRQICQHVGPFLTRRIADMIVPILGILPTRSKMSLSNSTWCQCRELILVNISPKQLFFFRKDQIMSWFTAHNIEPKYEDRDNPITIWGQKRG